MSLNDLYILSTNIGNLYLNYECHDKVLLISGEYFGQYKVSKATIVYDFFGLKSVGGSWRDQLSQKIVDLGFIPCRDDPYVWMHEKIRHLGLSVGIM